MLFRGCLRFLESREQGARATKESTPAAEGKAYRPDPRFIPSRFSSGLFKDCSRKAGSASARKEGADMEAVGK